MKPELLFKAEVPDYRRPVAQVFTIIDYAPMGALPRDCDLILGAFVYQGFGYDLTDPNIRRDLRCPQRRGSRSPSKPASAADSVK
jgi:hypothetical protein